MCFASCEYETGEAMELASSFCVGLSEGSVDLFQKRYSQQGGVICLLLYFENVENAKIYTC